MRPEEERLIGDMPEGDRAVLTKFLASRKALDDLIRNRDRLRSELQHVEQKIEEEKRVFEAARTTFTELGNVPTPV